MITNPTQACPRICSQGIEAHTVAAKWISSVWAYAVLPGVHLATWLLGHVDLWPNHELFPATPAPQAGIDATHSSQVHSLDPWQCAMVGMQPPVGPVLDRVHTMW